MTFPTLLLPLLVAMVLAGAVTTIHRRLPPKLAARTVTVTLGVVAAAAVPTMLILSLGYLAHIPWLGRGFAWCAETFGVHERIPTWVGVPAIAFVAIGASRTAKVIRTYRRLRHDRPGGVEVAVHENAFAFTLPGRGGRVVWSSGLVELLDDQEQSVVLAHEQAHARHRHDRYLLIAQCAAATVPFLRSLTSRLQFSLERWADESAVTECGDRGLVARTLGKVALHTPPPTAAMGFTGLGVPARVAALLTPPARQPRMPAQILLWMAIATTAGLAALQIHHLATVIVSLCPD